MDASYGSTQGRSGRRRASRRSKRLKRIAVTLLVLPETLETIWRQRRVALRRHDRPVPKIALNGPRVVSVVGELVAAGSRSAMAASKGSTKGFPRGWRPSKRSRRRRRINDRLLLMAASHSAARAPTEGHSDVSDRDAIARFVERIVISPKSIEIHLREPRAVEATETNRSSAAPHARDSDEDTAIISVSSAISFPKSSGEPGTIVPPSTASRALSLGSASPALISLWQEERSEVYVRHPSTLL
jgi:hypothetical protein